ncbi:MAG: hypothetical protein OXN18_02420 [Gemmatimonadota bacterium]|nr:hypothetical protein [Gemmatimonadota bacterium]
MNQLPIVGVMGSGARAHADLAAPLGRRLARLGVHLLTGGGRGVMASVSRAFAEVEGRAGLVIGILPHLEEDGGPASPPGYPNRWVELPIRTQLGKEGAEPDSRNHVNVLTSDVVVALPGSSGTASEVDLALSYGRPLILLGDLGRARNLPRPVATASTVDEVIAFVGRSLIDAGPPPSALEADPPPAAQQQQPEAHAPPPEGGAQQ